MKSGIYAAAFLASLLAAAVSGGPVSAGSSWDDIRAHAFPGKTIQDGHGLVTLTAPFRPEDQRTVPISIAAKLGDGKAIKTVTLVLDENPSPIAAVFKFADAPANVNVGLNVRLNQQSQVRAIVEASDGALYAVDRLVRFAGGQAACAAPPSGDPVEVARNMGRMTLQEAKVSQGQSSRMRPLELAISHPNHTGMQLDQQTLYYIPLRMVSAIDVKQGSTHHLTIEGSISLSENPHIRFETDRLAKDDVIVTVTDSEGGNWTQRFTIAPQS